MLQVALKHNYGLQIRPSWVYDLYHLHGKS